MPLILLLLDKELSQANESILTIQEQFAKNHGFELEEKNGLVVVIGESVSEGNSIDLNMKMRKIKKKTRE